MLSRRAFGAGLIGLVPLLLRPQTGSASAIPRWIDLHHHILPPEYVSAVGSGVIGGPAGRPTAPAWTASAAVEAMDAIGIEAAVTSISAPGILLKDARQARRVARACNEFARGLSAAHPGRFGNFAVLPLPDVAGALAEMNYALDVLGADGIGLLTSYDGVYPGDPHFAPLFAEFERRKAVIYFHPTPCTCSAGVNLGLPASAIEYPHETTRTIASLLFSGTLQRCPNVTFVFSHAGGTMPYIAERVARRRDSNVPDPLGNLQRLYYDVAQSANSVTLPALLRFAGPDRVVFGSDYPFVTQGAVGTAADSVRDLVTQPGMLKRIARDNALSFLPRLRERLQLK